MSTAFDVRSLRVSWRTLRKITPFYSHHGSNPLATGIQMELDAAPSKRAPRALQVISTPPHPNRCTDLAGLVMWELPKAQSQVAYMPKKASSLGKERSPEQFLATRSENAGIGLALLFNSSEEATAQVSSSWWLKLLWGSDFLRYIIVDISRLEIWKFFLSLVSQTSCLELSFYNPTYIIS